MEQSGGLGLGGRKVEHVAVLGDSNSDDAPDAKNLVQSSESFTRTIARLSV